MEKAGGTECKTLLIKFRSRSQKTLSNEVSRQCALITNVSVWSILFAASERVDLDDMTQSKQWPSNHAVDQPAQVWNKNC